MNKVIELLGKTVKFVHTENERFFERTRTDHRSFIKSKW